MNENYIENNLTLEELGRKDYKLYQIRDGFRFGTDTVLLSWFTASFIRGNSSKIHECLELGSNCGGAGICLAARRDNIHLDETEIMAEAYEVLKLNIDINGLENTIRPFNCDIRELPQDIKSKQYDIVLMNPPFFNKNRGMSAGKSRTRLAGRFEENGGLEDFVRIAASRVKPSSGYVTMVMHGDRLGESLVLFNKYGLIPTKLLNVHPFADREASMILLAGRRGVKTDELKILPPLILNEKNSDGVIMETERIKNIYEGEHLDCFI